MSKFGRHADVLLILYRSMAHQALVLSILDHILELVLVPEMPTGRQEIAQMFVMMLAFALVIVIYFLLCHCFFLL
jgi:hypothetical protein